VIYKKANTVTVAIIHKQDRKSQLSTIFVQLWVSLSQNVPSAQDCVCLECALQAKPAEAANTSAKLHRAILIMKGLHPENIAAILLHPGL